MYAPRKKMTLSIMIPFFVIALFLTIMIWQKYLSSQEIPSPQVVQQNEGRRLVTLLFTSDGLRLSSESRNLELCDGDKACLKTLLEELLNGPIGDLDETIPDGVVIEGVQLEADLATIELNDIFSEAIPSGSMSEMLAVYAIVNTITINFPSIQKVKLNIAGNSEAKLRHLDLSEPLLPDYSLDEGYVVNSK